jgi:hypothetical protein
MVSIPTQSLCAEPGCDAELNNNPRFFYQDDLHYSNEVRQGRTVCLVCALKLGYSLPLPQEYERLRDDVDRILAYLMRYPDFPSI